MPRNYKRTTDKCKWTQETLDKAIAAIKSGRQIREFGRAFDIHKATLRTKMKSGNLGPPKLGSNPTFTEEQENELVDHVIKVATFLEFPVLNFGELLFNMLKQIIFQIILTQILG